MCVSYDFSSCYNFGHDCVSYVDFDVFRFDVCCKCFSGAFGGFRQIQNYVGNGQKVSEIVRDEPAEVENK